MRPLGKSVWLVVSAAVLLLACLPLLSQTNTARILGSVSDSTGAAVSGATNTTEARMVRIERVDI